MRAAFDPPDLSAVRACLDQLAGAGPPAERLLMAIYHFHLHECGKATIDPEGIDCANDEVARERAIKAAREVMCSEVLSGRLCLACYIQVCDEADTELLVVPFREAVEVTGQ